jgi:hypothetical protein
MNTDSKTNKPKKNLLFLFSYEKKRETLDCFMLRNDENVEHWIPASARMTGI